MVYNMAEVNNTAMLDQDEYGSQPRPVVSQMPKLSGAISSATSWTRYAGHSPHEQGATRWVLERREGPLGGIRQAKPTRAQTDRPRGHLDLTPAACVSRRSVPGSRVARLPGGSRLSATCMAARHIVSRQPFVGRWRIVNLELWDVDDVLGPDRLTLAPSGLGELVFAAVQADVDYRVGLRDGLPAVEFSFEGADEGTPVSGRGWAALHDQQLRGRLFTHRGDESAFTAIRSPNRPARRRSTRSS
jgi:hypothetical protein